MGLVTLQDEALDGAVGLGDFSLCQLGALWLCGGLQPWETVNAFHGVCTEGLGMVRGKSGRGKLKPSCNQSRFPGVNKVSVRLKISLPVAELSHGAGEVPQTAPGWLMPGWAVAAVEVCGLWHGSYPGTKLR